MSKAKAHVLRTLERDDLQKKLEEYQTELAALRVEQVTGATASKVSKIKTFRKNIARVKTVMHSKQRDSLKAHYAGSKYKPLDLRAKKTRAQRRALTKFELSQKTARQQKRDIHFPSVVYALKA